MLWKIGFSQEPKPLSGAHNGLVAGSSPAGPTSLRSLRELRLGKPVPQIPGEASEGCRAEALLGEGGLWQQATPHQNIENNPMQSSRVVDALSDSLRTL